MEEQRCKRILALARTIPIAVPGAARETHSVKEPARQDWASVRDVPAIPIAAPIYVYFGSSVIDEATFVEFPSIPSCRKTFVLKLDGSNPPNKSWLYTT
jgi:hypothetical protein